MFSTSVIIPCWILDDTLLKLTHRCVSSIRDTSDVELVLINNGSKLGKDFLKGEADVYIENPKNLGYVKAINQGFKYSSGAYLVAGNNDYFLTDGWDKALIDALDNISDAGIVCPHTRGEKPDKPWVETGTPGGWWMIKRSLQRRLGFLDEDFFNVFADYDYLFRMWKQTKKRVYSTPETTVQHYGEGTLGKFPQRKHEYKRGQWLLLNKWKDDPNFFEYLNSAISAEEALEWMRGNAEYSQSTDYSS